jgi:hypothetical protein
MGGKIEQHVWIKYCVKLGKPATETLQMLHEAFGEHPLSWTGVLNDIHISRQVECQASAKRQKMLKEFENSSTKTISKHSIHSQTPLGSVMEFARRS